MQVTPPTTSPRRAFTWIASAASLVLACSTTSSVPLDGGADAGGLPDLCSSDSDCQIHDRNPTFACIFDVSQGCSAKGHCATAFVTSCVTADGAVDSYACNCADGGRIITTECGLPQGYTRNVPGYLCSFPDAGPADSGTTDAGDASDGSLAD